MIIFSGNYLFQFACVQRRTFFQVRMKAICVLEAILRKKEDEPYLIITSYFSENRDSVVKCSELPQASLREKAIKVSFSVQVQSYPR